MLVTKVIHRLVEKEQMKIEPDSGRALANPKDHHLIPRKNLHQQ